MTSRRAKKLRPADLDPDQRALYDAIASGPRSRRAGASALVDDEGRLEGPFNAFLLQPTVGRALEALGAALRYESRLADRSREIAILVVAAHTDSEFERFVHEPIARAAGVSDSHLAGVRGRDLAGLDAEESLVARATEQLLVEGDLGDDMFAELRERIGEAQVFELTTLVGYYRLLALQLRVFRVETPDHARPGEH